MNRRPASTDAGHCLRRFTALLVGLVLGTACVHAGQEPPAALVAPPGPLLLAAEIEVATLVNKFRALNGLPALRVDPRLCRAARKHSENMARQRRLDHDLDGRGPGDRAADEGFRGPISENVAGGAGSSPRSFFDLWLRSPAHRANLLALRTDAMGVGFARSPAGDRNYYTAMFGTTR